MTSAPLTHHDVLSLVEPFTRRGRHVDLAASNRLERRLVFNPIDHAATSVVPAHRETLTLECFLTGTCQLTRVLTLASGLQATLQATGRQPGELLARVEAVDASQQFRTGAGYLMARSYTLQAGTATGDAAATLRVLTRGVVQLHDLTLALSVLPVRRVAGDITLIAMPGQSLELPEDLLAVLGWDWARLIRTRTGWSTKLRLRGPAQRRTQQAEVALDRAAAHLARTLAEPPPRFHDRLLRARWGVFLRRAIPLLTVLGLFASVGLLPRISFAHDPGAMTLLFHVPTVCIVISYCMQELPRFEIPPRPRRNVSSSWSSAGAATATGTPLRVPG